MVSALDTISASATLATFWMNISETFASHIVPKVVPMAIAVRRTSASASPVSSRVELKDVKAANPSNIIFIRNFCKNVSPTSN